MSRGGAGLAVLVLALALGAVLWPSASPSLDAPGADVDRDALSEHDVGGGARLSIRDDTVDAAGADDAALVTEANWRAVVMEPRYPRPIVMDSLLTWLRAHPEALRELVALLGAGPDYRGSVWSAASDAAGHEVRIAHHTIQQLLARVGEAALPPLREGFREGTLAHRLAICGAYAQLGSLARPACAELVAFAQSEDGSEDLRVAALGVMAAAEHVPSAFAPQLATALRAGDLDERVESIGVVALMRGTEDRALITETLGVLLREGFLAVSGAILANIDSLTEAEAKLLQPDLLGILENESSDLLHESVLHVLTGLGPLEGAGLEQVTGYLTGPRAEDWDWRVVLRTLMTLGPEARAVAIAWAGEHDRGIDAAYQVLNHDLAGSTDHEGLWALARPTLLGASPSSAVEILQRSSAPAEAWTPLRRHLERLDQAESRHGRYQRWEVLAAICHLRPLPSEARALILEDLAAPGAWDALELINLGFVADASLRQRLLAECTSANVERRAQAMQMLRTAPAPLLPTALKHLAAGLRDSGATISTWALTTLDHLARRRKVPGAAQVLRAFADSLSDEAYASREHWRLRALLWNLWVTDGAFDKR